MVTDMHITESAIGVMPPWAAPFEILITWMNALPAYSMKCQMALMQVTTSHLNKCQLDTTKAYKCNFL